MADPAPAPSPGADDEPTGPTTSTRDEVCEEDLEDAFVEGDRTITPGTARAAMRHPLFRRVWVGSLLSNVGTWMQNITLGVFAFQLTRSETFVSWVTFAQLGPMLFLTVLVGGTVADLFDRRKVLLWVAVQQALLSLVLAFVVAGDEPSKAALLGVVLAIGIGQAVNAPTFTAVVPTLVPREDLPGAVSLQSVNMNASRVVGPAIGGIVLSVFGVPAVFVFNAASYLFIIGVLVRVRFPPVALAPAGTAPEQGLARVLGGFRVAGRDRVILRCLLTMAAFSFFCLPFIGQMAALAEENLGINGESTAYGLLYASFGLGALLGALSIGTVLSGAPLATVVRIGLAGFAVCLSAFALLRDPAPAYPVILLLGFCYFAVVTSLSTVLQTRLEDHERGRVMALWIMAFGGTVPIGGLVFGPIMEATSISAVVLFGAFVALSLILLADVREIDASAGHPGPK